MLLFPVHPGLSRSFLYWSGFRAFELSFYAGHFPQRVAPPACTKEKNEICLQQHSYHYPLQACPDHSNDSDHYISESLPANPVCSARIGVSSFPPAYEV